MYLIKNKTENQSRSNLCFSNWLRSLRKKHSLKSFHCFVFTLRTIHLNPIWHWGMTESSQLWGDQQEWEWLLLRPLLWHHQANRGGGHAFWGSHTPSYWPCSYFYDFFFPSFVFLSCVISMSLHNLENLPMTVCQQGPSNRWHQRSQFRKVCPRQNTHRRSSCNTPQIVTHVKIFIQ